MNSQLTTEQDQGQEIGFVESLQSIIVEKTDNGRTIVQFLLAAMNGELPDFQPCHKLEAARLLDKYGHSQAHSFIENAQPPTRRERRDSRRADRHIHSELAQIVREETDNGRTIVTFLTSVMDGKLEGFKPHHRMAASKELIRCGSQAEEAAARAQAEADAAAEAAEEEAEPELDPEEEEYKRRRAEAVEFSRHGYLYYNLYSFPCTCEDRNHDCDGNELSDERKAEVALRPPAANYFIHDAEEQEDYKVRYAEYLARLNPGMDTEAYVRSLDWRNLNRDP